MVGRSGSTLNGTSRVCSPSLTLDSGRGSSSAPSSPAKEMSPVQMSGGTSLGVSGGGGMAAAASSTTSSSSQNASPVFARKLSRPMEYLLGQQSEPGFVPDSSNSGSGNYATCCSSTSDTPTNSSIPTRARSSSGDGSNRSTPLSALYGTPHWWPESPPPEEHNFCPPAPPSSCNASPLKKPYLLNNLTNYIGATRLKGNSCTSSLTDHGKDLTSLESTHSQKSTHTASSSSSVPGIPTSLTSTTGDGMDVKKFTPTAFTIDFGESEGGPQAQAAEARKAAIAERLSKFAPRHRRNQSLTKSEDLAEDSSSKGKSGTNSLGRSSHHQKQSGVGNESCTSTPPKTGSLPKKLSGAKHPSGGSTSNNDSGLRSLSPETISSTTSSSSRSRPLASATAATESSKNISVSTPKS
ncbi:hypothetical protein Ocin01_07161, partial [Orchesella cincta]